MLDLSLWLKLEAFQMDNNKLEGGGNDKRKAMEVGPWGGNGGASWDDGVHHGVRQIKLVYGHCIDSISIVYDKNGKPVQREKHGGLGGSNAAEVKLQFPDEVLVSISGHLCPMVHGGTRVIRSLTFKTNRRTFGPYGFEVGTPFFFPVEGGRIVGFKGRSGSYLDAIGFHVVQVPPTNLLWEYFQESNELEDGQDDKTKGMEVGLWGGNGGRSWDDGVYDGVREIKVVYGDCIDSIRVVYDKNGKHVQGEKHGGYGGSNTAEMKLQFPDEILVSISGHLCPMIHGATPVIRSLTLKTNRSTFGPVGVEVGTPFFFPVEGGRIVGFKGRSGSYLDAIGFHIARSRLLLITMS